MAERADRRWSIPGTVLVVLAGLLIHRPAAAGAPPVPVAEDLDVATLAPPDARRLYLWDVAWNHAKDGRVWVVDGNTLAFKGMIPAAFYANFLPDPKGRWDMVAETIWTRGNRGDRQDLLTLYDATTLALVAEIPLPGRALVSTKKPDADVSADGRYVYIYDMEPASAVLVVDPAARKLAGTIEIPGCALVYPWGDRGFASLCADGSLASVAFDEAITPSITHTPPFHAPDQDPVFEHSPFDRATGAAWFISYAGLVYPVQLGATPTVAAAWSIESAAGVEPAGTDLHKNVWRPGGWQVAALHRSDSHLYVLMHQGHHWTHKDAGTEVWELDAPSHRLVRRLKLGVPVNSIAVSQDAHPVLYGVAETGTWIVIDLATGRQRGRLDGLGDGFMLATAQGE